MAFSYLGDIWIANEDGSGVQRITDNRAREIYPRFSPDGKWIAFSSNRYGNNDVFVVPSAGGAPRRLTFHTGNDEVVGWTRDSQNVIFRSARGDGAFPSVATLYQIAVGGGQEKPLPVDWGFSGQLLAGRQVAGLQPASRRLVAPALSRQLRRGSRGSPTSANKTYTKLLADEHYNRYWPMWGADDAIYFVADPLPNDKERQAREPRGPQERQQHLQDSRRGRPARAGHASTPTAACSGRRCRATAR